MVVNGSSAAVNQRRGNLYKKRLSSSFYVVLWKHEAAFLNSLYTKDINKARTSLTTYQLQWAAVCLVAASLKIRVLRVLKNGMLAAAVVWAVNVDG